MTEIILDVMRKWIIQLKVLQNGKISTERDDLWWKFFSSWKLDRMDELVLL